MTARWFRQGRWQPVLFRLLALVGLAVSSALVADHVFEIGSFCGANGACAEVAASSYGQVIGVPLAAVGLAGFGLLVVVSLIPNRWAISAGRVLAGLAGLAGLTLLLIQLAVLRQICPYCAAADLCAVGLAVVAALWRPGAGGPSGLWFWVGLFGWVWAGLAAALGPLIWEAAHLPAAAPEQARAHWVSGNVTMVEVTDFDCPHCQRADPIVREWLGRHPGVRFVRLVCPIPAHENAWPAALAYVAAARQGKGEEMATALYTGARDPVGCRRTAERLGLHLAAYDKVVKDPATESEIRATMKWVEESRLGLPFFWIQDELVVGTPAPERLDAALARAKPAP